MNFKRICTLLRTYLAQHRPKLHQFIRNNQYSNIFARYPTPKTLGNVCETADKSQFEGESQIQNTHF